MSLGLGLSLPAQDTPRAGGLLASVLGIYGAREGEVFDVANAVAFGRIWEDTARTIPAVVNGVVGSQRGELGRYYRTQATTANKLILRGSPAGATLIANGDFASDTIWAKGAGWAIAAGVATATASSAALSQAAAITAGRVYRITYTVSGFSAGTVTAQLTGGTTVAGTTRNANGTYEQRLTALAGNNTLEVLGAGFSGSVDDVTVFDVSAGQVIAPYWLESDGTKWMGYTMSSPLLDELKIVGVRYTDVSGAFKSPLSTLIGDNVGGQSALDRRVSGEAQYAFRVTGTNAFAVGGMLGAGVDHVQDGRWSSALNEAIAGVNGALAASQTGVKIGTNTVVTVMARAGGSNGVIGRLYCDAEFGGYPTPSELLTFRQWAASRSGAILV